MLSLSRTVYFYQPDTRRDEPVIHALTELAERYPRYGFKKQFQLLHRQGKWDALNLYCSNGWAEIDNNIAENALRGVALGRKNSSDEYCFCIFKNK
jgi:hypothetical protein